MTLKGGTSQACAACKYQRRKCTSECPLAPFFPADQPEMFQNAHRLFGVSNIHKILKHIDPSRKAEAMQSIICQSNIRQMFPVDGCCWVIRQLLSHLQQAEEELHCVRSQLAMYRGKAVAPADPASELHLAVSLPHFQQDDGLQSYNAAAGTSFLAPHVTLDPCMDSDMMGLQPQLMAPEALGEPAQEYDGVHPFFDTIDDRQSYIDSKESSSESSLKDTTQSIEQVAENELKSAAACFSLTSVN